MLYVEVSTCGNISDLSDEVLGKISKNMASHSVFRKTAQSCCILRINKAYPFFQMSRQTFPEFLCQSMDFVKFADDSSIVTIINMQLIAINKIRLFFANLFMKNNYSSVMTGIL